jgi:hypothetical protein
MSGTTLHEEIAAILRESGREWLTTTEIADEVNRRGRYRKRDGSLVSPYQIHGRTRNYAALFDRDGSRVRLRGAGITTPRRVPPHTEEAFAPVAAARPRDVASVDELIALLTDPTLRVSAPAWPSSLSIDGAGLYTWWTDAAGAADLTEGLGHRITAGLIYAGQTGGTTVGGVARDATLRSRIGGNHLRGRVRGSTFRFTLGAALMAPLQLVAKAPKQLTPDSESKLSGWMRHHLSVCTVLIADRGSVMQLEDAVLARLDPPLNLEGMQATSLRGQITRLRRELGST